jgi:membrane fusion protein, copper/silver efflux system
MNRNLIVGAAILAVLLSAVGGYRIGASRTASTSAQPVMAEPAARAVLYWKDPDGKNEFSPAMKKTADGRDYIPVYDDQEVAIAGTAPVKPKGDPRPLYYRNPMGLADTSPVPKKDSMGMDYIPVFADEGDASTVKVSLERVQRSGVRSEPVRMQNLARPVRASGVAKPDERTLRSVTLRADGYIEQLYINETGKHVKAGEPMFSVYSPQMVSVQVDYRNAIKSFNSDVRSEEGALIRLKNMGIPDAVIQQLRADPNPVRTIDWPSPMSGVVMEKKVVAGQMVKAGEELYRLADLSTIWVIANVAEQDIAMVKVGAPAKMNFRAYPGEVFQGKVTFILHELDMATRSAKVRIEVKNPDHRIKHEMFADVEINVGAKDEDRLVVPVSAVIDSGNRQVVIIDKGEGRFEPRPVKLGVRGDGFIEILDGIKDGEQVVTTANFLIDAESNLKAALQAFTAAPVATDKTPDAMPGMLPEVTPKSSLDKMGAKP